MQPIVIDCETEFNTKTGLTISAMGTKPYVRAARCYLVAMKGSDFEWAGRPDDAPWEKLHGARVICHNASFDLCVLECIQRIGVIPEHIVFGDTFCTADMCAYLGNVRDLKGCCAVWLKENLSKAYRKSADGKMLREIYSDWDLWQELRDACLDDARSTFKLYELLHDQWPEFEQDISKFNREGQMHGVHIDVELAQKNMDICKQVMAEAEELIPWVAEWREKGGTKDHPKTINARAYIQRHCDTIGLELPKSLNKKDAPFIEWKAKHLPEQPWLQALEDWQEAYRLLDLHNTTLDQMDENHMLTYNIVYRGAGSTGRMSAGTREEED